MTYIFDLDGTLCTLMGMEYERAEPIQHRIDKVNELYDAGHTIIIQTARGHDSDRELKHEVTVLQLRNWNVKYHSLSVGTKVPGDLYIDDKAVNAVAFFSD